MSTKTATVVLFPATLSKDYGSQSIRGVQFDTPLTSWNELPRTPVSYSSLDDLAAQVKGLADAYAAANNGKGVVASIKVIGRKPPGFDKRFQGELYFNLKEAA